MAICTRDVVLIANCSGGAEDFYRTEKLPVLWCFTVVSSLCAFTLVTVIININIVIECTTPTGARSVQRSNVALE